MRGRPPRHVADISLQLLHEQRVVPFQFNGWHGLLVQDFPVFFPELEEILYEVSSREIALIPIEEHGTLLVSLTRGYDPSHGPLPDLTAQAVLFTSDPLERRAIRVTASDEWNAFEQVCAYFSLPSREDVDEQCSALTSAAAQGMLHGNVYYRLPGWTGWCSIFFPTVVDRALMALMVYSGEGAQYSARVARFSPDDARCDQFVLQAPTPEGVLARALYHYRLGAIARVFLQHPLQSPLPHYSRTSSSQLFKVNGSTCLHLASSTCRDVTSLDRQRLHGSQPHVPHRVSNSGVVWALNLIVLGESSHFLLL